MLEKEIGMMEFSCLPMRSRSSQIRCEGSVSPMVSFVGGVARFTPRAGASRRRFAGHLFAAIRPPRHLLLLGFLLVSREPGFLDDFDVAVANPPSREGVVRPLDRLTDVGAKSHSGERMLHELPHILVCRTHAHDGSSCC